MNPEIRQTLNQFQQNLESANELAQENLYSFSRNYLDPCFSGLKSCFQSCTASCFPSREDQLRRKRGRSRGRAELNFDFYDDWDDDDDTGDGLLGWGNDELDRLLAGTGGRDGRGNQPRRQRTMSYGSRGRRKSSALPSDEGDPTIIPSSSFLGFLERLPWKIGGKGLKYKPSAADLQENPGGLRRSPVENEPLIEASDESDGQGTRARQNRKRSGTAASRSTINSLSSRGDLIPSDEEADAVPLDDEFAMVLERRTTLDDHSSGKTGSGKRPAASRASTRTASSRDTKTTSKRGKRKSTKTPQSPGSTENDQVLAPTLSDLKNEEDQVREDEEAEVERKREAAQMLATGQGLVGSDSKLPMREAKTEAAASAEEVSETSAGRGETRDSNGPSFEMTLQEVEETSPSLLPDETPTPP